ncbi:unnamed protein product [Lactuca saligna]|uniref:Uncharacterized protein n=1 Tax=Lactuca saligna TaxID=75948 RepID=A0AA35ZWL7_LACSI|nr:unnamed protein product [Lactuca saligna]
MEISCARFWSIIVKYALVLHWIQVTDSSVMTVIPIFHTSNFFVSDPTKFDLMGSILEAMLLKKGNEASGSKRKRKLDDDEEEEEEDISAGATLKRKTCDIELDEIVCVAKEGEAHEKEALDAQVALETQKADFPPWSIEWILNEAIENPSVYCLEPVVSFDLENTSDSQLYLPITPKYFLFRSFEKIEKASVSHNV